MQQIAGPSFINDQSLNKSNPNWDQASCSYFVMFFIIISPLQFVTRYVLSFIIDILIIRCYPAQHKAPLEFIQGYQLACHLNQQQIWFLGKKKLVLTLLSNCLYIQVIICLLFLFLKQIVHRDIVSLHNPFLDVWVVSAYKKEEKCTNLDIPAIFIAFV